MAIDFQKKLNQALQEINNQEYHELLVCRNHDEREASILNRYSDAQWKIVDLLNERYSSILTSKFDLYNWIHHNTNDEVAYFLSEAGSNCLNYADHKIPHKFHLWLGEKGFVIGIEQKGKGFSAEKINNKILKENEGAAFDFFRNCQGTIFFDNPEETRIVFMEKLF